MMQLTSLGANLSTLIEAFGIKGPEGHGELMLRITIPLLLPYWISSLHLLKLRKGWLVTLVHQQLRHGSLAGLGIRWSTFFDVSRGACMMKLQWKVTFGMMSSQSWIIPWRLSLAPWQMLACT
jgi:hypothetical protein